MRLTLSTAGGRSRNRSRYAEGQSRLDSLETVERGYANVVEKLRALGACVERGNGG